LALCLGLAAFATGGHNFAGSYRIMQATQQGAMVQVRLSLRVINYSGRDVSNATISLKSSLPHSADDPRHAEAGLQMQQPNPHDPEAAWEQQQPTFQGVTLHFNEHQVVPPLEATFTIPVREYAQWMKGARPNFVIEFQNAAGKTVRQPVELTNRP
jgi:hypothetical protein